MSAPLPVLWTLAGHTLTGDDADGCWWVTRKARGWRGSAKPRTDRTPLPSASGSWQGTAYRNERIITLDGVVRAPSASARADAEERLAQLLPDGTGLVVLSRTGENGLTQVRYVELDEQVEPIPTSELWFDWSLQVCAPDPRKFTPDWETLLTGGSVPIVGVAPMQLVIRLTGPLSGDSIITESTSTDQLRYRGTIASGQSVYINCDTQPAHDVPGAAASIPGHGALLGTTSVRSSVSLLTGAWPACIPGTGSVTYYGPGPNFTVYLRGAWD